jgi:dTDP-4-dehydrorhamnose reductase
MILILGSTGYVGQAFAAELGRRNIPFDGVSRQALDYTRFESLFRLVRSKQPKFVINAAGFTGGGDVSACEQFRAEAVQANTLLPQTVARVCYLTQIPWGHVSSGGIFSGAKVDSEGTVKVERDLSTPAIQQLLREHPESLRGWAEADEPNATFRDGSCSFYGGTKALAEESLRWFQNGYVWRPGPMLDDSSHPRNLLRQVQATAGDGVGSISHRADFVGACIDLWERRAPFGIYHIVNPGIVDAKELLEGAKSIPHAGPRVEAQGAQASNSNCASRSIPAILDASKLESHGIRLRPAKSALEEVFARCQRPVQSSPSNHHFRSR